MDPNPCHKRLETKLLDSELIAQVNFESFFGSYEAAVKFEWKSTFYWFTISEWPENAAVDDFLSTFHEHCPRDPHKFGTSTDMTTQQKLNCLFQAVSDIFHTIDLIASKHHQCLITYANWFRTTPNVDLRLYRDCITRLACDAIIESELTMPDAVYEDVRFQ
jgi:hypothetical protein